MSANPGQYVYGLEQRRKTILNVLNSSPQALSVEFKIISVCQKAAMLHKKQLLITWRCSPV
jgi:hypothetical protein